MKTSSCFVLAVLTLALVLANVASKTVQEPMSAHVRARSSLNGLLAAEGRKSMGLNEGLGLGPNSVGLVGSPLLDDEVSRNAKDGGGSCITTETCKKMKMICHKKCVGEDGSDVDREHAPGGKCIVKCKKCVPNC